MSQIAILIKQLSSKDETECKQAAHALLHIGTPCIAPLLDAIVQTDCSEEAIGYENSWLRRVYIELGEPAFQSALRGLQTHEHKRAMVKIVTLFDNRRAVPALIAFIASVEKHGQGKSYAMDALGYFKDPRAFDTLLHSLRSENLLLVARAARALAQYRDERALQPLQVAFGLVSHDWIRPVINEVIRMISDPTYTIGDCGFFITCRYTRAWLEKRYPIDRESY